MKAFHSMTPWACAYCMPPSYSRRFTPTSPVMNIGMNTQLMAMNEPQK